MREQSIQNAILDALSRRPDLGKFWRQNTGAAGNGRRFVRYGIAGMADISGILAGGRRVEIEVKSAKGRQSAEQRNWQAMIEHYGGAYCVVRSVDEALTFCEGASKR